MLNAPQLCEDNFKEIITHMSFEDRFRARAVSHFWNSTISVPAYGYLSPSDREKVELFLEDHYLHIKEFEDLGHHFQFKVLPEFEQDFFKLKAISRVDDFFTSPEEELSRLKKIPRNRLLTFLNYSQGFFESTNNQYVNIEDEEWFLKEIPLEKISIQSLPSLFEMLKDMRWQYHNVGLREDKIKRINASIKAHKKQLFAKSYFEIKNSEERLMFIRSYFAFPIKWSCSGVAILRESLLLAHQTPQDLKALIKDLKDMEDNTKDSVCEVERALEHVIKTNVENSIPNIRLKK